MDKILTPTSDTRKRSAEQDWDALLNSVASSRYLWLGSASLREAMRSASSPSRAAFARWACRGHCTAGGRGAATGMSWGRDQGLGIRHQGMFAVWPQRFDMEEATRPSAATSPDAKSQVPGASLFLQGSPGSAISARILIFEKSRDRRFVKYFFTPA